MAHMILVDVSGSMSDKGKLEAAKEHVRGVLLEARLSGEAQPIIFPFDIGLHASIADAEQLELSYNGSDLWAALATVIRRRPSKITVITDQPSLRAIHVTGEV